MRCRFSDLILHCINKVVSLLEEFVAVQFLIKVFDRFAEVGSEVIEHVCICQFRNC